MSVRVVANRYELQTILGEGGMGIVYQALDRRTDGPVAIKTLKNASDRKTREMFHQEWKGLEHLVHPNIVGVRDVGEFEENGTIIPFFVMPLLRGCTLAALIKSSSPRLTVENVVEIVCQVCRGLHAAHEKDFIHRDLKPSNIFVNEDGTAQIIDFGLIYSSNAETDTDIMGTRQYMSPEQTEGKRVTRTSDIFSLGVVAYEALTGTQPFWRESEEEIFPAIRNFSPPPLSELNPKVSDMVGKSIHVAMAKQPIFRYSSAREFAETLQKAYHNKPVDRIDPARIQPKISRAREAFDSGDSERASDLLMELEAEGAVDPQISLLRAQVAESTRQKKHRKLFQAAQVHLKQNEPAHAINKLSLILNEDPDNSQAAAQIRSIKKQRDQNHRSNCMKRAKEYLEHNDFSEARRALDDIFKLQYDEPEAQHLRAEIDTREKDAAQARLEEERLYHSALRAKERGELSAAISTIEKLFQEDRSASDVAPSERLKVYRAFHAKMLAEREALDSAYQEGVRYLSEKNFESALQVCDQVLSKNPDNPLFKALRIRIRDAEGIFLSTYIADVGKAVENEPNLDRRVAILEEASARSPNEPQFTRQLQLAREHRDLVASIIKKATTFAEQEQFVEALQQWKILANTHPLYPDTPAEIRRLESQLDRKEKQEKRNRSLQRINQALANRSFAHALQNAAEALYDFPGDPVFLNLQTEARNGLDQLLQADQLFKQAKTFQSAGALDDAIDLLKNVLALDQRHFAARGLLINLLCERAHAALSTDPPKAELLAQSAREFDPQHPSVKRITDVLAEKRRVHFVANAIAEARELKELNPNGALFVIDRALHEFPGEPRLIEYRAILAGPIKTKSVVVPAGEIDPTRVYQPESPINEVAKPAAPTITAPPVEPPNSGVMPPPKPKPTSYLLWILGISGLLIAAIAATFMLVSGKGDHIEKHFIPKLVDVSVVTDPKDADLKVDDTPYPERLISLRNDKSHPVTISHLGYQTLATSRRTTDNWQFTLTPEPLHINITTKLPTGDVLYDGRKLGTLNQGSFSDSSILPDGAKHVLSITNQSGDIIRCTFTASVGKLPIIDPLESPELTVISSLGEQSSIYTSAPAKISFPNGQAIVKDKSAVDIDLRPVDLSAPPATVPVKIITKRNTDTVQVFRGNAPVLNIFSAAPSAVGGTITVITKTGSAQECGQVG